jgi:hypothetical protein
LKRKDEEASSDIGSVKTNAVHLQNKTKMVRKKVKMASKNKINHHK